MSKLQNLSIIGRTKRKHLKGKDGDPASKKLKFHQSIGSKARESERVNPEVLRGSQKEF